ncbi:MAG: phosphopantothenoylcysteine decarboxylase [Verrucomicrobia bacterium]|nr:phosphopantothenoylcysteine decarboxylase [Verrucomicrobiota bacterium]
MKREMAVTAFCVSPVANAMRFLITAGPTREWLDPVRFISNPSSGKMGYALARVARQAGATVTLVSGPVALAVPHGVEMVRIETAAEMAREVFRRAKRSDIIILSAAVADWTPVTRARHKVKKEAGGKQKAKLVLTLKPTMDIAATLGRSLRPGQVLVGFAAETQHVEANAKKKLERKNFDMIVANDVSRPGVGFGSDCNEIIIIDRNGIVERPRRASKRVLARRILKRACAMRADKMEQS